MIVAGMGFRRGASAIQIEAALARTLESLGPVEWRLKCIAVPMHKGNEPAVVTVAQSRGVDLMLVAQDVLEAAGTRAVTRSVRALAAMNVPSVAEAAALAGAGGNARLLVPRVVHGPVTCAIAECEETR